jgi:hypothetical protein
MYTHASKCKSNKLKGEIKIKIMADRNKAKQNKQTKKKPPKPFSACYLGSRCGSITEVHDLGADGWKKKRLREESREGRAQEMDFLNLAMNIWPELQPVRE